MKPDKKHCSKLSKGFEKQVLRQDLKPSCVKIKLLPAINLPANFKGKYKHCLIISNNKWNGMNLKCLANKLRPFTHSGGGMYSKFTINTNGKYILSRHGKDILRKKKLN